MATTGTVEQYGFWALLVVMLVRDLAIPLANKIIPAKVKAGITYEERVIVALENSNKSTVAMVELMRQTTEDHKTILAALTNQGNALTGQGKILEVLMNTTFKRNKQSPK